jgi:hypothetical protein
MCALKGIKVGDEIEGFPHFLFFVAKPTILTAEYQKAQMKIGIFTILIFIKICVISAKHT